MTTTFNEKSSFTADGIAYRRIFTDIPLSREIWQILIDIKGEPPPHELERMKNRDFLPFFEARYLATDRELRESGITQVLELASGLCGRGLSMTSDPNVIYVEIDLPEKMTLKKAIVARLIKGGQVPSRPNLYLEEGNVVDGNDLCRAAQHFDTAKPIAIICEGLLRYLAPSDRQALSRNILKIISPAQGIWVTPDIEFADDIATLPAQRKQSYDAILKNTGLNVVANLFKDDVEAHSFFHTLGFNITTFPLEEVVFLLASPTRLNITSKEVAAALRNRWLYVMKSSV